MLLNLNVFIMTLPKLCLGCLLVAQELERGIPHGESQNLQYETTAVRLEEVRMSRSENRNETGKGRVGEPPNMHETLTMEANVTDICGRT